MKSVAFPKLLLCLIHDLQTPNTTLRLNWRSAEPIHPTMQLPQCRLGSVTHSMSLFLDFYNHNPPKSGRRDTLDFILSSVIQESFKTYESGIEKTKKELRLNHPQKIQNFRTSSSTLSTQS